MPSHPAFYNFLRFTWENSSFYRALYGEHGIREADLDQVSLQDLPIVSKQMIRENYDEVVTDARIRFADLEEWLECDHDPRSRFRIGNTAQRPDRIRLSVVPEVRQRLEGLRWVRNEAGVTQVPNYSGRAFGAAGFAADLEPGRFLLIAPGEQSGVSGLVGNSFLVSEEDGQSYDSYVFLRADVNHVAQRY